VKMKRDAKMIIPTNRDIVSSRYLSGEIEYK